MKEQKLTEDEARNRLEEQKAALMAVIQAQNERQAELMLYDSRPNWAEGLDERQWGLVQHCRSYVNEGACGLPGHQLMVIVDHLASELEFAGVATKHREAVEFEQWLNNTFGSIVQGNKLKDRVWSVIRHYATQMGRWVAEEK